MKKVYYLAGMAGLAPAAAAFLAPSASAAAQDVHSAAPQKTVSLHPTRIANLCEAHHDAVPQNRNVKGGYWYSNFGPFNSSACVGKVNWSVAYGRRRVCHNLTVTIDGDKFTTPRAVCGSGTVKHTYTIPKPFLAPRPYKVCLGARNVPGYACKDVA